MKKRKVIMIEVIGLFVIGILGYLQYGGDVSVYSSRRHTFGNGSTLDLTIIANRLYIRDKEEFAEQMLQRCVDNSFHEIRLSYDMNGYPNELSISVYMNPVMWKLKKRVFRIKYMQDLEYQYDIRDGIGRFKVEFVYD